MNPDLTTFHLRGTREVEADLCRSSGDEPVVVLAETKVFNAWADQVVSITKFHVTGAA